MQILPENVKIYTWILLTEFHSCGVYTPTLPVAMSLLILDQILFTSGSDIQK
jgi:hypothetical protein